MKKVYGTQLHGIDSAISCEDSVNLDHRVSRFVCVVRDSDGGMR